MLRQDFIYPEGIYLDGNSLGLASHSCISTIERRLKEWQDFGVNGWESWFRLSESLSGDLGELVGAIPEEVIATGSTTMNLHNLLATLYKPTASKKIIVATTLDFSSDLYAIQSWTQHYDTELRLIASRDGYTLTDEDIEAAFQDDVALIVLPTVLYVSGQLLNIERYAKLAQEKGIIFGLDAAHSIGSVPHDFHNWGVDFAVWCSYKYLNSGPGAVGGAYIHEKHLTSLEPAYKGWWGHSEASRFAMPRQFESVPSAEAWQLSNAPVFNMLAHQASLEIYQEVGIDKFRNKSIHLVAFAEEILASILHKKSTAFTIITPHHAHERGSMLSLYFQQDAKKYCELLMKRGVMADLRGEHIIRVSFNALYNSYTDVVDFGKIFLGVLDESA